jgi:hypothetical protein
LKRRKFHSTLKEDGYKKLYFFTVLLNYGIIKVTESYKGKCFEIEKLERK